MVDAVVSPGWLAEHLGDVVVCEVEPRSITSSGRKAFEHAHVPGARLVSVEDHLAAAPAPVLGRHPMPRPEEFASALGALGVSHRATVVAYDRTNGEYAARLVWMLRILGEEAALLDGGVSAWSGPLERGSPRPEPVERRPVPWPPDAMASADDVALALATGLTVVDSRAAARFRGDHEPIDAVAGHIPGAINLPYEDNLRSGRLRTMGELAERFARVPDDPNVVVYCGSGVTACHNALAMEHAGRPRPRVYIGSWSGWSSDPERPVATGDS